MNQPGHLIDMNELKKGLQRVGLCLTEPELMKLSLGDIISLEKRDLGTIGSLFILASATSALNLGRSRQLIAFQDLPKTTQDCQRCSGIPLYCWNSHGTGKQCLYLTVAEGNPAVRVCCHTPVGKRLHAPPIELKT